MSSEAPMADDAGMHAGGDLHRPINGSGAPAVARSLDEIEWHQAYDRPSVERYLAALDAERSRLEAEIADAERRIAAAAETRTARTAQQEAGLGAVVLAAQAELQRIEREKDEAVAAIQAEAAAEVARIREAARAEADGLRAAAVALEGVRSSASPAWPPPSTPPAPGPSPVDPIVPGGGDRAG